MKVARLIELLEEMDQDADVLLATQSNWPYAELRIMRTTLASSSVLSDIHEGC